MKVVWSDPIDNSVSIPTFHCDCGEITEGFQICLKCNPQTYKVKKMYSKKEIAFKMQKLALECVELIYNAGYNDGIEAAALIVQPNPNINEERRCEDIAVVIRSLKR